MDLLVGVSGGPVNGVLFGSTILSPMLSTHDTWIHGMGFSMVGYG